MGTNKPVFHVGDRVRLRSGGQEMTVVARVSKPNPARPKYRCAWHDAHGDLETGTFPAAALVPAQACPDTPVLFAGTEPAA